jgi:pimeloyl-ACP methyl ester carboxylesterase
MPTAPTSMDTEAIISGIRKYANALSVFAASNVTDGIVPNSGHWIMEENTQATIKLVTDFLAK